jgi:phage I-like protein
MADLIELASKQGRAMPFEEAYRKACSLNPQIAAVLEKRKADAALVSGKDRANGKRNASSSVPARGANVSENAGDKSLRGTITSIWDSYAE